MQPVKKLSYDEKLSVRFNNIKRFETELKWIKLLQTTSPLGFNDNIYHEGKISKMSDFDVCSLMEFRSIYPGFMVKGKKKITNVKDVLQKNTENSLTELSTKLREHSRHALLLFLCSLPIPVLCILDIEAYRFYDRNHQMYDAALLIICYTQHALRPLIDSDVNHKRHFIKIPFIDKGIDFIDLSSIHVFEDKFVTSCIPFYFQTFQQPIICYNFNKPIRNKIFNFNKLVSDLDIDAILSLEI